MAECETYLKGKGDYIPEEWKSYPIESTKKLLAGYIENFDEICSTCSSRIRINKVLELKGFKDTLYNCLYTGDPINGYDFKKGGYNIIILDPNIKGREDKVQEVIFVSLDEVPDIKKEIEDEYNSINEDEKESRYRIIENMQIDIKFSIEDFREIIFVGEQ